MKVLSVNFHYVRRNSFPLPPVPLFRRREDVKSMIGKVRKMGPSVPIDFGQHPTHTINR